MPTAKNMTAEDVREAVKTRCNELMVSNPKLRRSEAMLAAKRSLIAKYGRTVVYGAYGIPTTSAA